jgi:dihydroxy-acid dehydratase
MDAKIDIKKRLPSRHVTDGPARHRSYLYAMGLTSQQIHQPFVGVASGWNEAVPCNISVTKAEIFKKTPCIADLKPAGRYVAKDMVEAGDIPLLMKTLLDHGFLHGDCLTVTGRTIAENLKSVKWNPHQDVVRPADEPITVTGGVVGPGGNLAPEGAIVKVAGMSNLRFTGPARCFDREEDAFEAVQNRTSEAGEILTTRDEGPRDCPGMREPTSTMGGLIRLLRDGDLIEIDAIDGSLNVKLTDAELAERKTNWLALETNHASGALWIYAQQFGPAVTGAVTHPGGAHEKQCYADI